MAKYIPGHQSTAFWGAMKASAQQGEAMGYGRNKRDGNEAILIKLAEQLGACWREAGPLDGWVWVPRLARWFPVEIKLPEREGTADEYTIAQHQFIAWCTRNGASWWVWRTGADVMRDLNS